MSDGLRLPEGIATIPAALDFWAERTPDALALLAFDGESWSYRALRDAVAQTAQRLLIAGTRPGAPVALLPGSAEACIALLAAGIVGAAVPLNPRSTGAELRRDLGRLGASILIAEGTSGAAGHEAATAVGMVTLDVDELVRGRHGMRPPPARFRLSTRSRSSPSCTRRARSAGRSGCSAPTAPMSPPPGSPRSARA